MLEEAFTTIYIKFKLAFYRKIFSRFESREATLTAVETFCVEAIHALGRPTINEFANFVEISPANATYKVNSLVKKGYVVKVRSEQDKRECFLEVTQKFNQYYGLSIDYVYTVIGRMKNRFSPEQLEQLEQMLFVMNNELTPEIVLGD